MKTIKLNNGWIDIMINKVWLWNTAPEVLLGHGLVIVIQHYGFITTNRVYSQIVEPCS